MAGLGGEAQATHLHPRLHGASHICGAGEQSGGATLLLSHAEAGWLLKCLLLPNKYFCKTCQLIKLKYSACDVL
jgi:hypothetical protein